MGTPKMTRRALAGVTESGAAVGSGKAKTLVLYDTTGANSNVGPEPQGYTFVTGDSVVAN